MRMTIGALWGQIVVKTEDLPFEVLAAVAWVLDVEAQLPSQTLLVGDKGTGVELYLAMLLAKHQGVQVTGTIEFEQTAQGMVMRRVHSSILGAESQRGSSIFDRVAAGHEQYSAGTWAGKVMVSVSRQGTLVKDRKTDDAHQTRISVSLRGLQYLVQMRESAVS